MKKPPRDFDTLRNEIVVRLPKLSRQLQKIARFALEHPNDIALETVTMIASHTGVAPSAMIRFAKALDYRGFSDMQAVFRLPLTGDVASNHGEPPYWSGQRPSGPAQITVLDEVLAAGMASLRQLAHAVRPERLERAIELLAAGQTVYAIGQRRAFPVAIYLACLLHHQHRQVYLLDGMGGMLSAQARDIADGDVLLAVSFPPYALEMAELAARAVARGAAVIAITDSTMDPIVDAATVSLEVREQDIHACPSMMATVCLAQGLVIGAGLRRMGKP